MTVVPRIANVNFIMLTGCCAARRVRTKSLMQYTVKYVVNVRINALYRLELSAFVFASTAAANSPDFGARSASASSDEGSVLTTMPSPRQGRR